jgi:putative Mg2+ transporter-C (MgtC) family protein
MDSDSATIIFRLLASMLAGGIIGLERTFHGRPAGFRTHTLVCTSSTLLMLMTVYQWALLSDFASAEMLKDTVRVDPTRMGQGIMTGIGFLGAGVIMKEKLSIRGLTTAGSIWMTASIGIIIGMGFYLPAIIATIITLGVLAVFRWIENVMPTINFSRLTVRFMRKEYMHQDELFKLIKDIGIKPGNASYTLSNEGKMFEYQLSIRTSDRDNFHKLAEVLGEMEQVYEFSIVPIGD